MQSQDEMGNVLGAQLLDDNAFQNLQSRINQMNNIGAVKHVIGELPKAGTVIEHNGLRFEVLSISSKKGTVHMKLMGS